MKLKDLFNTLSVDANVDVYDLDGKYIGHEYVRGLIVEQSNRLLEECKDYMDIEVKRTYINPSNILIYLNFYK